ncbi:hypothetical protein CASFOL_007450 [Castilleja foliolosa]|uniref:Transmembrane protein n=1 Tax=Castilleja foliolosa TaxID=1961234 RepID=A0ABD3EA08_9LAMI
MAIDHNIKKSKPISCFSFAGCFGFCHEERDSNIAKTNDKKLVKHGTRTSSGRARARTVPVSQPMVLGGSSEEVRVVEGMETSDDRIIVAPQIQSQQISNKKVHDMSKKNKKICRSSQVMDSIKFDKNSSAQESSNKPVKILQSVSLSPPTRLKKNGGECGGEKPEKGGQPVNPAGQLDPMVGALIMTVTLIVMLIWGEICAIICTSAWFYIIQRFRANNDILNINNLQNGLDNIDVDSWENKRKVVLEGFLKRF